jgi:uncharacterized tellurite resistance protein B-like protein
MIKPPKIVIVFFKFCFFDSIYLILFIPFYFEKIQYFSTFLALTNLCFELMKNNLISIKKAMLNKDFYIIFGKLLYALAKSDGFIQDIEKNKIMDLVKEKMVLIEKQNDFSGTDLAYYTEFAFEAAEEFELTLEDALLEFNSFFKLHHVEFNREQKRVLTEILEEIATIYGKLTTKELEIIKKFKDLT